MRKKTLKYTFLAILISLGLLHSAFVSGQSVEVVQVEEAVPPLPLYRGLTASVDLFGIGNKLFGGNTLSSEIGVEANLKNKFFPVVEVGFGHTDETEDTYDMHYKTAFAPYGRIGLNYNTMSKNNSPSYLYVGVRYGITAFSYDVDGPPLEDGIWEGTVPFVYHGQKSNAQWAEFLVGIKVKVYRDILMGWSLRYKALLTAKDNPNTSPSYIPGYGKNKSTLFGVTYSLIYNLPF